MWNLGLERRLRGEELLFHRLKRSPLKVRFCTNESQKSRRELVGLLQRLGFDISEGEVTAPAPATCQLLKERGLRPHLLIHDGVRSEFGDIDMSNPNCVVIGDAGEGFSYQNMNKAFQVLMELENPVLISLGKGRYYKETSGLMLDVGCYMKALEYACGIEAEVVGKPSPEFFRSALQSIGLEAHQAIMIGDDIVGDVGGAQQCGMRALQVRTGKFRPGDEHHPEVKADGYVDNLAEAVGLLLQHMDK
ncbi:phospholysine phosphohistidine inorganic pyrophosphate phosphatase isoform X2 [Meriones unguiculatus]|uniref:phospholysine phosphohistidine inorganic pyrophosphate phosphatase isoform X2 n=1 Tax=Meriones unguiculatus TaxID=10047 RepID=UPI00293E4FDC|nr:phospholysine phosphohistidine inorganic pyrophosphate phosphatase isoform X2 [Meriones unguiculatus]XP_060237255.1 phospholysine phosphohistidine inorganic pyrophosphate phosphatase isoform X2 [Meriones unguiculatus]